MSKVRKLFYKKIRGHQITKLMARDGLNCRICEQPLDRHIHDEEDPRYITFDHIIPRSRGGQDELKNIQLAHKKCNNDRGDALLFVLEEEADTV